MENILRYPSPKMPHLTSGPDGRLKDIEIKSERFKFLKDWIVRLQQPDVHEFPNDVGLCRCLHRRSPQNELSPSEKI
jgi:hypothetical protein